jgi:hypothetical protein
MYNNEEEGMKKVKRAKKVEKTKKAKKTKKMKKAKKVLKKKKKVMKPRKVKKVAKAKKVAKPKKVVKKAPKPAPVPAQKVEHNQENAILCICTKCPVQSESKCAGEKVKQMEAMMEKGMPEGMMPPPADLPGLYCATGVATCKDLDFSKMCICGGCPVWDKCKLSGGKPAGFFCRDGKAL